MRTRTSIVASLAGGVLVLAAGISTAAGQTYQWSGTDNNQWNTTSLNWYGGGLNWVNSSTSTALFPSSAGGDSIWMTEAITAGAIRNQASSVIINGGAVLTLTAPATINMDSSSQVLILHPSITGSAGLTLNSGRLFLYTPCTYSGPTVTNSSAELQLMVDNVLPVGADLTLNGSAGSLLLHGSQQIGALNGNGKVFGFAGACTLTVAGSSAGAVHSGEFHDFTPNTLAIRKIGPGKQSIGSSFSNYSQGTSIEGGTLIATSTNACGVGPITVQVAGALGLSGGVSLANTITVAGAGDASLGVINNISGNNTLSNTVSVASNVTIVGSAGSLTMSQPMSCGAFTSSFSIAAGASISVPTIATTNASGVMKTGSGELVLTGPSGFTTPLRLISGRVTVGHAQALSGVPVQISAIFGGQLNLGGYSPSIPSLTGGDGTTPITNSAAAPAVLTVDVASGTQSFGGVFTNGAGTVGLKKLGAGMLELTGASSATGPTTVSVGTLTVSGSLGNTPVTINGGTLDGNGNLGGTVTMSSGVLSGARTISGLLTVNGGTVRPAGAAQGTLTLGNGLTATGGTFELQGPNPVIGYDQIVVTGGNVQLGSGVATLTYSFSGTPVYGPTAKLTIINNSGTGTTSGYFAGLPDGTEVLAIGGYGAQSHWFIYYNADLATGATTGGNDVVITPIAPSTLRNGGFENGTGALGTLPVSSQTIANWTVSRSNVDWASEWPGSDGIRSVDLLGLNAAGGIRQLVSLQPGTRYRLTFGLAGNPDNLPTIKHMRARVNGSELNYQFDITGKTRANMGWTDCSFAFIGASGNTEIEFYSTDPAGSWGAVVDNVRLVAEPCAVDVAGFGGSAGPDGQVTVDDIVAFLSHFFGNDRNVCDIVAVGGSPGSDGLVAVDDLVAFLSGFFAGCP